jgi:hypothetical protein
MASEMWWRRRSTPAAPAGGSAGLGLLLRMKRGREEVRGDTRLGLDFIGPRGKRWGAQGGGGKALVVAAINGGGGV